VGAVPGCSAIARPAVSGSDRTKAPSERIGTGPSRCQSGESPHHGSTLSAGSLRLGHREIVSLGAPAASELEVQLGPGLS
jgi:hypothetical protein